MVGVDRATARSAALCVSPVLRPVAARATVCGHGVRGRVACSALLCLLRWRSSGRPAGFVAWGATSPWSFCVLCNIEIASRYFVRGW